MSKIIRFPNFNRNNDQEQTPRVIESYTYDYKYNQEIIYIEPTTEVIKDYAFYYSITYDRENEILNKNGMLKEIHLPIGIELYPNATTHMAIDFSYQKTGIPFRINSKITDRIKFVVYDPLTKKKLFSISYPVMQAYLFTRDYRKITLGEFNPNELENTIILNNDSNFDFSNPYANIGKSHPKKRTKKITYLPNRQDS